MNTLGVDWVSSISQLIADVVLASLFAVITDKGVLGIAIGFALLQAIYLLVWAKHQGAAWLGFAIYGRKHMREAILSYLRTNAFPRPDDSPIAGREVNPVSYFNGVAWRETVSMNLRIFAATQAAYLDLLKASSFLFPFLRWYFAYSDALTEYRRTTPQDSASVSVDDAQPAQPDAPGNAS